MTNSPWPAPSGWQPPAPPPPPAAVRPLPPPMWSPPVVYSPWQSTVPVVAPPKRSKRWIPVLAIALVLASFAAIKSRNNQPRVWDPRVTDLVSFVERERGLSFRHPVPFLFMTDADFTEEIVGTRSTPSTEDTAIQDGILRARGFVGPGYDSVKTESEFVSTVDGYYNHDDKKMRVRGTELTPLIKLILVHELTHALLDQIYPTGKLYSHVSSDEEAFALRSLLEGDARYIENSYYRSLGAGEQKAVDEAEHPAGASGTDDTPDALIVQQGAPYELGAVMVGTLRHLGGVDRLNQAYRKQPTRESAVLLPFAPPPEKVSLPDFPNHDDLVKESATYGYASVGTLSTFLTLSSQISSTDAWRAAAGLADQRIQIARSSGSICVDTISLGKTSEDTQRLRAAFTQWAGTASTITITDVAGAIQVRSCDPGVTTVRAPRTGIFPELFQLTETDQALYRFAEKAGLADQAKATCVVLTAHQTINGAAPGNTVLETGDLLAADQQVATDTLDRCR